MMASARAVIGLCSSLVRSRNAPTLRMSAASSGSATTSARRARRASKRGASPARNKDDLPSPGIRGLSCGRENGGARGAPPSLSSRRLERKRAGPQEVGETRALLRTEQRVDLAQGFEHGSLHVGRALHAAFAGLARAALVEGVGRDGVGVGGETAALFHRRLRALGLEIVQDGRELRHLLFVHLETMGEKAQRTPHAEGAGFTA